MRTRASSWIFAALVATSCVYFNSMYDANQDYELAVKRSREGREVEARTRYDSVIAITDRIVKEHPESEYAAPAALLKARSEIARRMWESAAETAARVPALTSDSSMIGVAAGLEGIARRVDAQGPELREAERLLTRALATDLSPADRVLFLFHRGLVRLDAGEAELAAEDLEAVGNQERLAPEVRFDLARGVGEAGRYSESLELTGELLKEESFVGFRTPMDAQLDSLVVWIPRGLSELTTRLIESSSVGGTTLALLHYYRGRSREMLGDSLEALADYDSAWTAARGGRYSSGAAYRWALLQMRRARRPSDVSDVRIALSAGRQLPDSARSRRAAELLGEVEEFTSLVDAVEARGATAAEAALRAAEIAGVNLGARHVARGLYLEYLSLAPRSPWRAKAIAGVLAYADTPAGEWAQDQGPTTDDRLREELSTLPGDDPYRVSVQGLERTPTIDSAYVAAERALRRRMVEIRMLYDTTAVLVEPVDSSDARQSEDRPAEDEVERARDRT